MLAPLQILFAKPVHVQISPCSQMRPGASWLADSSRGRTVRLYDTSSDLSWAAATFCIGDFYGCDFNASDTEMAIAGRGVVSFWMKNNNTTAGIDRYAQVAVYVRNSSGTARGFTWTLDDYDWNYHELDVAAAFEDAYPSETMSYIDCILFYCKDIQIDDLMIGNGRMKASYQTIPGVALGGVLGCQTGEDFDADGETQWYYHYNELGTVVATTGDDGAQLGVYMPDYYGNYRTVVGARPDTLGLTGKFYDELLGLYYFNQRWYDPVRGRWMSKDPAGYIDGLNLYRFSRNAPNGYVDTDGLVSIERECRCKGVQALSNPSSGTVGTAIGDYCFAFIECRYPNDGSYARLKRKKQCEKNLKSKFTDPQFRRLAVKYKSNNCCKL